MKFNSFSGACVLAILSGSIVMSVGCGSGFEGTAVSGNGQQGGGGTPPVVDPITQTNAEIAKLNTNLTGLNTSITGANGQLGLINLLLLQTNAGIDGNSSSNKVSKSIAGVLDGVVNGVQGVYTEISTLNGNITKRIAALNPAVATDAKVIAELQTIQIDLANFKTKVDTAVLALAANMGKVVTKVNSDIAGLNPSSPLTAIVILYWVPVETQIQQHATTLQNLTH